MMKKRSQKVLKSGRCPNFAKGEKVWVKDRARGVLQGFVREALRNGRFSVEINDGGSLIAVEVDGADIEPYRNQPSERVEDVTSLSPPRTEAIAQLIRGRLGSSARVLRMGGRGLVRLHRPGSIPAPEEIQQLNKFVDRSYGLLSTKCRRLTLTVHGGSGGGMSDAYYRLLAGFEHRGSEDPSGAASLYSQVLRPFISLRSPRRAAAATAGHVCSLRLGQSRSIVATSSLVFGLPQSDFLGLRSDSAVYSVFLLFCRGASTEEKTRYMLLDPSKYRYLRATAAVTQEQDMRSQYVSLRRSMVMKKFDIYQQDGIFRTLSGLLWLGNVAFETDGTLSAVQSPLQSASRQLGLSPQDLGKALSEGCCSREEGTRRIQAAAAAIYRSLVTWIVEHGTSQTNQGLNQTETSSDLTIHVVDAPEFDFCVDGPAGPGSLAANYVSESMVASALYQERDRLRSAVHDGIDCPDVAVDTRPGTKPLVVALSTLGSGDATSPASPAAAERLLRQAAGASIVTVDGGCVEVRHLGGHVLPYSVADLVDGNDGPMPPAVGEVVKTSACPFVGQLMFTRSSHSGAAGMHAEGTSYFGNLLAEMRALLPCVAGGEQTDVFCVPEAAVDVPPSSSSRLLALGRYFQLEAYASIEKSLLYRQLEYERLSRKFRTILPREEQLQSVSDKNTALRILDAVYEEEEELLARDVRLGRTRVYLARDAILRLNNAFFSAAGSTAVLDIRSATGVEKRTRKSSTARDPSFAPRDVLAADVAPDLNSEEDDEATGVRIMEEELASFMQKEEELRQQAMEFERLRMERNVSRRRLLSLGVCVDNASETDEYSDGSIGSSVEDVGTRQADHLGSSRRVEYDAAEPSPGSLVFLKGGKRIHRQEGLVLPRMVGDNGKLLEESASLVELMEYQPPDLLKRLKEVTPKKLIRQVYGHGQTLLHLAALSKAVQDVDVAVVKALVKYKVDPNARDTSGCTAIMYAASLGKVGMFRELLPVADVRAQDRRERTILHYLCSCPVEDLQNISSEDLLNLVQEMVKKGSHPVDWDIRRNFPVHCAAEANLISIVEYFLTTFSIPCNVRNSSGKTLLHLAAAHDRTELCRFLMERGAHPLLVDNHGVSAAELLSGSDSFCKTGQQVAPLRVHRIQEIMLALEEGDYDILERFLATRRSTKEAGEVRNECLILAAARGQLEFVQHLLADGASTRFADECGNTALMYLCGTPFRSPTYNDIITLMVSKGADIDHRNKLKETALHWAIVALNRTAFFTLMQLGVALNKLDLVHRSELHLATFAGDGKILSMLLSNGCDPSFVDPAKNTVFDYAKSLHRREAIYTLTTFQKQSKASIPSGEYFDVEEARVPNVCCIRVRRAVLQGDKNGVDAVFFTLAHSMVRQHVQVVSPARRLDPQGNLFESVELFALLKTGTVFHREASVTFYRVREEAIEKGSIVGAVAKAKNVRKHHFIGQAELSIFYSTSEKSVALVVPIQNTDGEVGSVDVELSFLAVPSKDRKKYLGLYKDYDPFEQMEQERKQAGLKRTGLLKAKLGYVPKYPILLVPGMASTALEVWKGKAEWHRERVWLDVAKLGKIAPAQRVVERFGKRSRHGQTEENDSDDEDEKVRGHREFDDNLRRWMKFMLLGEDGVSDPVIDSTDPSKSICVRPVPGLHGCDYLCEFLGKSDSYIFGPLIRTLSDLGYNPRNLDACTYDWRLPPCKLEERDGYFSMMKHRAEVMHAANNEKIVLVGHSMGNKAIQYFLHWVDKMDPSWCEKHVHAFLALGAPFLGAAKTLRTVLFGDSMGLDVFCTTFEAKLIAEHCASMPWIFPLSDPLYPDEIVRAVSTDEKNAQYASRDWRSFLTDHSPKSMGYYESYFRTDPLYEKETPGCPQLACLQPPPIKRLWCVYGVNLPTEVGYFMKVKQKKKKGGLVSKVSLDRAMDKHSEKKVAGINPLGLSIDGGIVKETPSTFQSTTRTHRSGDGTVPYCSLSYPRAWAKPGELLVRMEEIEGAEHREMLKDDRVHDAVVNFVCEKGPPCV